MISSCVQPEVLEVNSINDNVEPEVIDPLEEHKKRMLAVKKKYGLSNKALSEYRFVFQRFDADGNGEFLEMCFDR